jgi:hypothetical protein
MRNSLLILLLLEWPCLSEAQASIGFEQYFYAGKTGLPLIVPVIYFQDEHNWFVQSNINYEQSNTFSVCVGKTFSENGDFSYSVTPMLGAVMGSLKGGLLALNTEMRYKKILFNSQSHFVFSFKNTEADLLNSWMELGYQLMGQTFIGVSMQATVLNAISTQIETGVFIRCRVKKWNFPVYCFNTTSTGRYFILGVAREFSLPVKKKYHAIS